MLNYCIEKKIIYKPEKKYGWMKSHCMVPTPLKIKENIYRIFFASRNKKNQSQISFLDYNMETSKILTKKKKIVFSKGNLGAFDDNGVIPSSVIKIGKKLYLFYIGWKPGSTTRYSLVAGLAISKNNGLSFKRWSKAPILFNNDIEYIQILTAPFVLKENRKWKMWYVSGTEWREKDKPLYNIKYAVSKNGTNWTQTKRVCIRLKKGERAVARPCVIKYKKKYIMFYCYEEKIGKYKIGNAISKDGINWKRLDNFYSNKNLLKWENQMQCYPSVIKFKKDFYMFYNGNKYGKTGFGIAKLQR